MSRKGGTGVSKEVYQPQLQASAQASEAGADGHRPPPQSDVLIVEEVKHPAIIEYEYRGVAWRCGKFADLVSEFENGLVAGRMAEFHETMSVPVRGWMIVRRLFSIMPVTPGMDADPDDIRSWTRAELRKSLGLENKYFQEELDAMRGHWIKFRAPQVPVAPAEQPAPVEDQRGKEMNFDRSKKLLKQHNLKVAFADHEEEEWFMLRVQDFEKALEDKAGQALARNLLTCELQLSRLEALLNDPVRTRVGEGSWKQTLTLKRELEEQYSKTLTKLTEICPWTGGLSRYGFKSVMSDVTLAIQKYCANADNQLIDGIFTATEVMIECRQSVQLEPRYRAGLVTFLNAARSGLMDTNWKPDESMRSAVLGRIDKSWREVFKQLSLTDGQALVDLEKDGEEGEYPVIK